MIQRELYIMETAKIMEIREDVLFKTLAQIDNREEPTFPIADRKPELTIVPSNNKKIVVNHLTIVEDEIIKLIMQFGDLEVELKDDKNELYQTTVIEEIVNQFNHNDLQLSNPFYQSILDEVKIGLESNELRSGTYFSRSTNQDITQLATQMMIDSHSISENWKLKQGISTKTIEDSISKDLFDVLLRFKALYIENEIKTLMNSIKDPEMNEIERSEIIKKVMELTKIKMFFNSHLDRII